jgi:Protein of unknown function (DUF1236)
MSPMRYKFIVTTTLVSMLAVGSISVGQGQNPPESQTTSPKVSLTMEQRYIIKEIVKDRKVQGESSNVKIGVGEVIPKAVQLQAMPADVSAKVSQVRNYSFFLKDAHIVLVDPKDNKVVDVIDLD